MVYYVIIFSSIVLVCLRIFHTFCSVMLLCIHLFYFQYNELSGCMYGK